MGSACITSGLATQPAPKNGAFSTVKSVYGQYIISYHMQLRAHSSSSSSSRRWRDVGGRLKERPRSILHLNDIASRRIVTLLCLAAGIALTKHLCAAIVSRRVVMKDIEEGKRNIPFRGLQLRA